MDCVSVDNDMDCLFISRLKNLLKELTKVSDFAVISCTMKEIFLSELTAKSMLIRNIDPVNLTIGVWFFGANVVPM